MKYVKPDNTPYSTSELLEMYELFYNSLFSTMINKKSEYDAKRHAFLPERFIELCPDISKVSNNDYEDPLEFLSFLCYLTKPITNRKNHAGQIRKSHTECLEVYITKKFRCDQCQEYWNVPEECVIAVNLYELLQKE